VLLAEKQAASTDLINLITHEVAETLPEDVLPTEALTLYARTLPTYWRGEIAVYNKKRERLGPQTEEGDSGSNQADQDAYLSDPGSGHGSGEHSSGLTPAPSNILSPEYQAGYAQALIGETEVQFQNSLITTYAPLYLNEDQNESPIGFVVASQAAQDFNQAILRARRSGLFITALSMSALFGILLLVVARADRIITTRSKELMLAYKNLRQAEGARDDLTNMIIHDLRNPLSIIYGTLGLVRHLNDKKEYTAKRTYHLEQALRASERITGLIDDILTVGKMEAGQLKPNLKPNPVRPMLTEGLNLFSFQAAEENKQLILDCPESLNASFDANLIGRVVDNLVSNALKYTPEGGRIQVRAWTNNGHLLIRIRDNGDGIPDEYKRHIFEKFAQAPNATTRKGTGLGLAFCGLVVHLHQGKIWVDDAPDGGSDFIFRLPAFPDD
jgi:signal transduction histidine kinase